MNKYIAYYRVSTREQGESGLGLESQKNAVCTYVNSVNGILLNQYTEIDSGKNKNRKTLKAAIAQAHSEKAILVVKKLDRLSRAGLHILVEMEDKGIQFIESDSPNDSSLIREIKLSFAREEAKNISDRTKAGLSVIKDKIKAEGGYVSKAGRVVKALGSPQNLTPAAVERSVEVRAQAAMTHPDNVKAAAMIKALKESGNNFAKITEVLNNAGFKTSKGNDFSQVQTKRIYERFKEVA